MTRIIEHRSALPFGPVVEVHVRHDVNADPTVYATINVTVFGQGPDPDAFPQPLPAADAFQQAIAYGAGRDHLRVDRRPWRPLPAGEAPGEVEKEKARLRSGLKSMGTYLER